MVSNFGAKSVSTFLLVVGAFWCCCSSWRGSIAHVDAFSFSLSSSSSPWVVTTTTATKRRRPHSFALQNAASPKADDDLFNISEEDRMAAVDFMKSMDPSDLDKMIADVDTLPKAELKAMGMDADIIKATLQLTKSDPSMLQSMAQMMETMSADEIMEGSRKAQQTFTKESLSEMAEAVAVASPATATAADDEDEDEDDDAEPVEPDPQVLDAMFSVAEIMSVGGKNKGGVTFAAFCSIPPVAVLSGPGDDEDDLTPQELTDCWNTGSLGATRVDRAGFERVWRAVQDNYYNDIVEEAQDRLKASKKKKRGSEKPKASATAVKPTVVSATTATTPMVGANISPDQLAEQVKSIKDEDLTSMFEQMNKMTPAEEARMRAMGVDPEMMKKSAEMMKNNPLMRKAATMMIKNTSPEQLMKASQQAQERMATMTEEEKKKMFDNLK